MPPMQQEESQLNFCSLPGNMAAARPAHMETRFSMGSIPENEESIEIYQLPGKDDNCLSTSSSSTSLALPPNPFDKTHDCEEIDIDFCYTPSSATEIEVCQPRGCELDFLVKSSLSCEVVPGVKVVNGDNTISERHSMGLHTASVHGDLTTSGIANTSDEMVKNAATLVHAEKPILSRDSGSLKAVNWGDRVGIQTSHVSAEPRVLTKKTIQYSLEPVFARPTRTKSSNSSTFSISTHRKGQSQSNNRHSSSIDAQKMCISTPPAELLMALQAVEAYAASGYFHEAGAPFCPSPFPMFPFEPSPETMISGNFDPYQPVRRRTCQCARCLEDSDQLDSTQLFKGCKYSPLGSYSLACFQPITPPMSLSSESQSQEEPRGKFLKGKMNCCFPSPRKRIQPKPSPQEGLLDVSLPESTSQPSVIPESEVVSRGTVSPADTSILDASQPYKTSQEPRRTVPECCVNVGQRQVSPPRCSELQMAGVVARESHINAFDMHAQSRSSCSSNWLDAYCKGRPPKMLRLMSMSQKCDPVETMSVGVQEGGSLQPPSEPDSPVNSDNSETATQEDPRKVDACCQLLLDCCCLPDKPPPSQPSIVSAPGAFKESQVLNKSREVFQTERNSRQGSETRPSSRSICQASKSTHPSNFDPFCENSVKGSLRYGANTAVSSTSIHSTDMRRTTQPRATGFLSVATSTTELPQEQCCNVELQDFACQSLLPMMSKMCQCNQPLITGSKCPEIASKAIQSPDPRHSNADISPTRQSSESSEGSGSCSSTGNPRILYIGIASQCKQTHMSSTSSYDGDCEAFTNAIRCPHIPWKGCRPSSCLKESDEDHCNEDALQTQSDRPSGRAGITRESLNAPSRCVCSTDSIVTDKPQGHHSRDHQSLHQEAANHIPRPTRLSSRNAVVRNEEDSHVVGAQRCFTMSARFRRHNDDDSTADGFRTIRVDIDELVKKCSTVDMGQNNHRRQLSTESEAEDVGGTVGDASVNTTSILPSDCMLLGLEASASVDYLQRLMALERILSFTRRHGRCQHFSY
uniref:Uncharacterized protein n=1 Tax=Mesocestoides corti TaxID=53468 RepID=A0A5K3F889_MESCO